MIHEKIKLTRKDAEGYVIPLGPVNLVTVVTDTGMAACGAFDVDVLDKYAYPAVQVKSPDGSPIVKADDILSGIVKHTNTMALKRGIKPGLSGKEALELM